MKISIAKQPDGSWLAIDADTYDVDCDENGFFAIGGIGYGDTRQQAIYNLLAEVQQLNTSDEEAK
jgi:hypothetical protein